MHQVGTALMIANKINNECNNKYKFVFNRSSYNKNTENENSELNHLKTDEQKNLGNSEFNSIRSYNEIGFSSVRGGNLVGEHTVLFLGENETIELTHTANSRNIYIEGALAAAKFIITKKNGMYSMNDLV